ncbi:MAG: glycosyltransferase family 39 protein [Anaerolineales bacterium]|nr:glycosyltransferase family 39 protein [Anaerolineales bacterium]
MQYTIKSTATIYTQQLANFLIQTIKSHWLFIVILTVGIFARIWDFNNVPPGLNPDEASIGVEAYYLYKFGMDRNGISYPVHLISWGSGQNALYAYMIIPFIVLRGLTTEAIRLPMIVSGILSLPLMYYVGKRLFGIKYALVAMFFMAISPWHIVNTRWAVESNILPFIFLTGFAFFLAASNNGRWFIPASACFALCLYAYGTAYVAIPIFMVLGISAVVYLKKIETKYIISGLLLFFLFALPIILFVIINTFKLDAIHIGSVTVPRLPVEARYESLAVVFEKSPVNAVVNNLAIMLNLLWKQEDNFAWNFVEPFGYFYKLTFPLVVIGFFFLTISFKSGEENIFERWLLFSWIISSIFIGIVHPVNLTRINLIFIPILFCLVICLIEFNKRIKYIFPGALVILFCAFILFTLAYHGDTYQKRADEVFNAGIIPAIEYANENTSSLICISEQTRFAYIYILLVKNFHPSEYLDRIEWLLPSAHPLDPARSPRALGSFRFRLSDCIEEPNAVFVLKLKETPPNLEINYKIRKFTKYQVYLPKIAP